MRCFACDCETNTHDTKTDRYYCLDCLEPTNRVLLRQLDEEMNALFGSGDDSVSELDFEIPSEDLQDEVLRSAGVHSPGDEAEDDERD